MDARLPLLRHDNVALEREKCREVRMLLTAGCCCQFVAFRIVLCGRCAFGICLGIEFFVCINWVRTFMRFGQSFYWGRIKIALVGV